MPRSVILTTDFPLNDKNFVSWSRGVITTQNGAEALKVFPNLPVLAAQMNPLTDAVSSADQLVDTRVRGAKPARTSARNDCEAAHRKNATYCEETINGLPVDQQGNAVAHSGYGQKGKRKAGKAAHAARRGAVAGEAIVDIKAVARHGTIQYVHAYSINNAQTWVELPPTLAAHITVPGLPVGTTVLFRWRTLLDGVYGDWSPSLPYQVTW